MACICGAKGLEWCARPGAVDEKVVCELQAFEREIFKSASRAPADGESSIFMCKGLVVLYRTQDETTFFVVGSDEENEVILVSSCWQAFCSPH